MKAVLPPAVRRIFFLCVLPGLLLTGCPIPTDSDPVDSVDVSAPRSEVEVGQTVQLSVVTKNASGQPLLDRTVSWSSSNNGLATVDGGGLVRGIAPGPVTITASSEGKSGTVALQVRPPVTAPTVVTLPASDITATSGTMTGTVNPNNGQTTWGFEYGVSSGNLAASCPGTTPLTGSQVQTVACNLTGIPATVPTIFYRVYAENSAGRSNGEIRSFNTTAAGSSVSLTAVSPDPLVEGQSATLTGSGFSATPAGNQVTIGGMVATVTSASETSLQITVPRMCRPAGNLEVRVAVGTEQSNVLPHPFRPSAFLNLPVGHQLVLSNPADFCLQFQQSAGAEAYLIGVQSTSETVSSMTPVALTAVAAAGAGGGAGAGASIPAMLPQETPGERGRITLSPADRERAQRWNRHRQAEARRQEWARRHLYPRLRQELALRERRAVQPASVPATVKVGDIVNVRYPDEASGDRCVNFIPISAVVRAVGARGIWIEDTQNPSGGYTAADFQQLSDMFDAQIYSTLIDYFGVPTDLDSNQRIIILTSKEVNKDGGALGFVDPVDFQSRTRCPSSNQGEIYYGIAPDPTGTYEFGRYSRADALEDAPPLIAHEVTHIIQMGRRGTYAGAIAFQTTWESEGQATFAEEVVGHAVTGRRTGQNYGGDVALNTPKTTDIYWYRDVPWDLMDYFGFESTTSRVANAPEQCSWLARPSEGNTGPCHGNRLVYGVTASFLRWISDHYGPGYPGGEKALHRALIDNRFTGFATIADVVGVPIDSLLVQWAAMLYVDDRVPGAQSRLTLPSWNLVDIFGRLNANGRLQPRERAFSSFTDAATVRAASTAYFRVSGAGRPATAIQVRAAANDPLPAHMRLWIVRLQ